MNDRAERTVRYTEDDVVSWCEQSGDQNPLHLDEDAAADGPFSRRIVPGMMILDSLSAVLTDLAEADETIILSGITAARFRDPVLFDEDVQITVDVVEDENNYTSCDFEAHVEARGSLVANGVVTIVVK